MSYTVTKYTQGTFSWADALSTDSKASKAFMTAVMGWNSQDMPTEGGPDYTMFSQEGHNIAGLSQMPENMKGVPSHWNSYITVNNLDEVLSKVESLGGKISMPTMQVMTAGKMAGIQDPTGAMVMLWKPQEHIGTGLVNTVGAMSWNELITSEPTKAQEFYGSLLGWTFESMPDMNNYIVIKNNGRMNGGIVQLTKEMGQMPPHWGVYFTIKDIKETKAKIKENGGQIVMDMEADGVGKIALVADPANAHFYVIENAGEATPWEE